MRDNGERCQTMSAFGNWSRSATRTQLSVMRVEDDLSGTVTEFPPIEAA